jgi:hypothetical protein
VSTPASTCCSMRTAGVAAASTPSAVYMRTTGVAMSA